MDVWLRYRQLRHSRGGPPWNTGLGLLGALPWTPSCLPAVVGVGERGDGGGTRWGVATEGPGPSVARVICEGITLSRDFLERSTWCADKPVVPCAVYSIRSESQNSQKSLFPLTQPLLSFISPSKYDLKELCKPTHEVIVQRDQVKGH